MSKLIIVLSICLLANLFVSCGPKGAVENQIPRQEDTMIPLPRKLGNAVMQDDSRIVAAARIQPVITSCRPVIIYKDDRHFCVGTLFPDSSLYTVSHAFFADGTANEYKCRILQPEDTATYWISDAKQSVLTVSQKTKGPISFTPDVALCHISKRKCAIPGFSAIPPNQTETALIKLISSPKHDTVYDLLSGQSAFLISLAKINNNPAYIIAFPAYPGRSGSGFINKKGELFVLTDGDLQGARNPQIRTNLNVAPNTPISYICPVSIGK